MKQAIILHGMCDKEEYYSRGHPSASNYHWLPWLQNELLIHEFAAHTPEVVHSFSTNYETWKDEIKRYEIDQHTILVGHSAGAGFFLRYLVENPDVQIDQLVLVAPWIDPLDTTLHEKGGMFDFDFSEVSRIESQVGKVVIFYSTDDPIPGVSETIDFLQAKLTSVDYHKFTNAGHFTLSGLDTEEFPELLEVILDKD